MKLKLLFITLFCSVFFINAQTNKELANKYLKERQELAFTFTANNYKEVQELSKILSFDHGQDRNNLLTIKAIANPKEFKKFLAFNLPFVVDKKKNDPKNVAMYNPKLHNKGVSGKNAAYPLTFPLSTYPTYQQYADQMAAFAADHPSIAQLIDIGGTSGASTVDPRLLFIKLSDNVTTREQEPRVMYTSSMHGDEIAGYPGMLNLINYFITAYEDVNDPDHARVKNLLDNSEVWINPMANPEGTFYGSSTYTSVAGSRRANANNIDLNRNYPDNVQGAHPDGEVYQIETLNFMALADTYHFVLSANFHGGTEVVNYPWDNTSVRHPDNDWYYLISKEYAVNAQNNSPNGYMEASYTNSTWPGVTNGSDWYTVFGGRQDYMNYYKHAKELTIELSNVKTPPTSNTSNPDEIIDLWNYNKEAYINYLIQGTYGFRGIVKGADTGNPIKAKITLVGHDALGSWVETELPLGDYYRPINAGTYDILYEADCYQSYTLTNQTIADGQTIVLPDVTLTPSNTVPSNLSAATSATSATLNWDDAGVTSYDIQYRESGTTTWTTVSSATNSYNLTGLTANTTYEFKVRSVCNTPSNYSSIASFTTLAVNYCASKGNSITYEYISNVQLNGVNNNSQSSTTSGYSDYTNTVIFPNLDLNSTTNSISVTKFWPSGSYNEAVVVWIDFNKNGVFETSEIVLNAPSNKTTPVSSTFSVPGTASLGNTRMRVSMKYNGVPTACETFTEGEVEDYTVNIVDGTLGLDDKILSAFKIYPNPANNNLVKISLPNTIQKATITISNTLGQKVYSKKVQDIYNKAETINTSNFKTGIYFVTVNTKNGKATKKLLIL
jgi:hypothetical protein